MSAGNRIAIIAVGFVAMVLAFVALQPDDEPDTTSSTTPTVTERTTTTPQTAVATQATTATTTAPAGPETFTVAVRGGQPVDGVQEIDVDSGDAVRIRVTADAPEEVHLHGYDIEKPVGPGQPAVFDIDDANLEGIFEIELHGSAVQIANLRVSP